MAETVGEAGEDRLVAAVVAAVRDDAAGDGGAGPAGWLLVPPGDDAAVADLAGPVVLSTDTLVEGPDFLREWSGGYDVGVKAAAQNLADVAAMGAEPRALLVSLAAPAGLPVEWAYELSAGLRDECRRAGAVVIGGDVSAASEIVVTGTAVGVLAGVTAVRRSGAGPGDLVALAGTTGPSAAGWAALRAGRAGDPRLADVVAAHLRPRPPYRAGPVAARAGATALIDVSDGLVRDAARIAAASGVVLDLDPGALRPEPGVAAAAELLGADPAEWVLTGGEDHALLACFPADRPPPAPFTVIGSVGGRGTGDGPPAAGVRVGGRAWDGGAGGWRHWA